MGRILNDKINYDNVKGYLSPTWDKDVKRDEETRKIGKITGATVKQIAKNISEMAVVKINRIMHAIFTIEFLNFKKGEWVNNKAVSNRLLTDIRELKRSVASGKSDKELEALSKNLHSDQKPISEIFKLLNASGARDIVKPVDTELLQLYSAIEDRKTKIKRREEHAQLRRQPEAEIVSKPVAERAEEVKPKEEKPAVEIPHQPLEKALDKSQLKEQVSSALSKAENLLSNDGTEPTTKLPEKPPTTFAEQLQTLFAAAERLEVSRNLGDKGDIEGRKTMLSQSKQLLGSVEGSLVGPSTKENVAGKINQNLNLIKKGFEQLEEGLSEIPREGAITKIIYDLTQAAQAVVSDKTGKVSLKEPGTRVNAAIVEAESMGVSEMGASEEMPMLKFLREMKGEIARFNESETTVTTSPAGKPRSPVEEESISNEHEGSKSSQAKGKASLRSIAEQEKLEEVPEEDFEQQISNHEEAFDASFNACKKLVEQFSQEKTKEDRHGAKKPSVSLIAQAKSELDTAKKELKEIQGLRKTHELLMPEDRMVKEREMIKEMPKLEKSIARFSSVISEELEESPAKQEEVQIRETLNAHKKTFKKSYAECLGIIKQLRKLNNPDDIKKTQELITQAEAQFKVAQKELESWGLLRKGGDEEPMSENQRERIDNMPKLEKSIGEYKSKLSVNLTPSPKKSHTVASAHAVEKPQGKKDTGSRLSEELDDLFE